MYLRYCVSKYLSVIGRQAFYHLRHRENTLLKWVFHSHFRVIKFVLLNFRSIIKRCTVDHYGF